jgi:hypothetical protein
LAYDPTTPTNWAGSAGLSTPGTDYINTSLATATFVDETTGWVTFTFNATGLAVIKNKLGTTGGAGFIMIGEEGATSSASGFHSSEYTTDASVCPKIVIDHSAPNNGKRKKMKLLGLVA